MPLDPSILSNAFANAANNMPDVNALMQQRVRGAENIYQIETARQAQAAEDAKAAAKAQEDAAIKALLPAYTYGIQTGDMAGALNLVPPEMQDSLTPYVDALTGKSPQEVQAALIGSLSSSPAGQEALAAIQRGQTAQIQMGQLEVSRGNLALDRQKAALDAKGLGEWKLQEAEGGFFWTNPRTREVIPADVTGGAAPAPAPGPAPDVVTPRQPVPGAPAAVVPGTAQAPAFRPKAKEGKEDDLTEGEGKAVNFTVRMADSDAITNELEEAGVATTDAVTNFFLGAVQSLPLSAGANLASQLESAFNATLPTLSPEEQRLARAQLDFVTAILRSESGAEIKTSEFPAEYRKYFPTEGDEGNEKLLADKRRARKLAIKGMRAKAGKRGQADIDRILEEEGVGTRAPAVPAPAAPGTSLDGFTFRGVKG
jgi:hypothetical protein